MVIWINGAFGAGKTKVAGRLAALRGGARLLDPERIGFMLRRLLPTDGVDDFQDLPIWRELTVRIVREAAAVSAAPLIVPMTLADPAIFEEVIGGLRASGVDLRHFTLTASPATLRRRLRRRLDWPASRRWAMARAEACAAALAGPAFAEHVDTEDRSVAEIATEILARTEI
jgi:hypothetical protein